MRHTTACRRLLLFVLGSSVPQSQSAGSSLEPTTLVAWQRPSMCEEMQQLMSPYFTDADFINAWLTRTWEDPRVYSPVNRPAMAQQVRMRPEGVPRTSVPKDLVAARLKLKQIHGIDEKRQYYEAEGSLTLSWTDERFCFNATGWVNETTSLAAHSADSNSNTMTEGSCRCSRGEREAGLCACLRLSGTALENVSSWMWLPDLFILNSAGGGAGQRSKARLEQTLLISHAGSITWSTRFAESLATDFSLDSMPFDSQNLTLNIGGYESSRDLQLIWADDQDGHASGNASDKNSSQRSYAREKYDSRANAALAPKGWDICSATAPRGSSPSACGGTAPPQPCTARPCLQYLVGLSRNSYAYMFSYIYPSMLLLGISYLALFVDKGSPGRPGIHSVTVLTELTLANAQRTALPPVNNNMWIMSFMNTMLMFHIAIFVEFGVVHYAERRRLNELLVANGKSTTPAGPALTKSSTRPLLRPTSPSHLIHVLELEEASETAFENNSGACCATLWLWHRHAGKIDWFFRISMPPCVGIFWLQMMFSAGYTYSYEYLAAYVVVFVSVCMLLGWDHLQLVLSFCCGWCCDYTCCKRRN